MPRRSAARYTGKIPGYPDFFLLHAVGSAGTLREGDRSRSVSHRKIILIIPKISPLVKVGKGKNEAGREGFFVGMGEGRIPSDDGGAVSGPFDTSAE
jgi:hypothetical protein